jgi:PRC-barrel domain protein
MEISEQTLTETLSGGPAPPVNPSGDTPPPVDPAADPPLPVEPTGDTPPPASPIDASGEDVESTVTYQSVTD